MNACDLRLWSLVNTVLCVVADWGRFGAPASLGQPQCASATYGGANDVQGEQTHSQSIFIHLVVTLCQAAFLASIRPCASGRPAV